MVPRSCCPSIFFLRCCQSFLWALWVSITLCAKYLVSSRAWEYDLFCSRGLEMRWKLLHSGILWLVFWVPLGNWRICSLLFSGQRISENSKIRLFLGLFYEFRLPLFRCLSMSIRFVVFSHLLIGLFYKRRIDKPHIHLPFPWVLSESVDQDLCLLLSAFVSVRLQLVIVIERAPISPTLRTPSFMGFREASKILLFFRWRALHETSLVYLMIWHYHPWASSVFEASRAFSIVLPTRTGARFLLSPQLALFHAASSTLLWHYLRAGG